MRKVSLFASVAILAAICSCSVKVEDPVGERDFSGVRLTAYTESRDSKTSVVDGGTIVFWNTEDEIKVFSGEGSGRFVSCNAELSQIAEFAGPSGFSLKDGEGIAAVYPFSEDAAWDGESFIVALPSEQVACAGTFAKGMNLAVAKSEDSHTLQFKNVGGGVRFSLKEEGVKKVIFEGLNGETIAGTVKIGFEDGIPVVKEITDGHHSITLTATDGGTFEPGQWYFITALPSTLSKGYKMTLIKDSAVGNLSSEKAVAIKRSTYGSLAEADKDIAYNSIVVVSSQETSDIEFVEKVDESTIRIMASEESVPKVGDYICSGITEEAPYGFFYKVQEVIEEPQTKGVVGALLYYDMKVLELGLQGILALTGEKIDRWFDPFSLEVSDVSSGDYIIDGNDGVTLVDNTISLSVNDKDITPFQLSSDPSPAEQGFAKDIDPSVTEKTELKGSIKTKVIMYPSMCRIYLYADGKKMELGYNVDLDLLATMGIDIEASYSNAFKVAKSHKIPLKPFAIDVGVPIVFTPELIIEPFNFKYGGSVKFANNFGTRANLTSAAKMNLLTYELSEIEGYKPFTYEFEPAAVDNLEHSLSINGYFSLFHTAKYSLGLYGTNLATDQLEKFKKIDEAQLLSIDSKLELETKLSASAGGNFGNSAYPETNVIDDCSLITKLHLDTEAILCELKNESGTIDFKSSLKLWDWKIGTRDWGKEYLHFSTLAYPQYDKLKAEMMEDAEYSKTWVKISAIKYQPLFYDLIDDISSGLYMIKGNDPESLEIIKPSVFQDVDDETLYGNGGKSAERWDIMFPYRKPLEYVFKVDVLKLDRGVVYTVVPFSEVRHKVPIFDISYGNTRFITRKPFSFKLADDGSVSEVTIDDVPGENL